MTLYEDRELHVPLRRAGSSRFHLEARLPSVHIFKVDPGTGDWVAGRHGRRGRLVDLSEPIVIRAGGFRRAVELPLIRLERRPTTKPSDVNRQAFGQDDEARLVDQLREGCYFRVSLIAEQAGGIVGHILFSDLPIITNTGRVSSLALAPMAVLPEYQRLGIGSALIRRGLELCRELGHRIVVVLGHPRFYPRFGFSTKLTTHLNSPFTGTESFMALELSSGALEGVMGRVAYSPPFGV